LLTAAVGKSVIAIAFPPLKSPVVTAFFTNPAVVIPETVNVVPAVIVVLALIAPVTSRATLGFVFKIPTFPVVC
jgi:hypothetical protein